MFDFSRPIQHLKMHARCGKRVHKVHACMVLPEDKSLCTMCIHATIHRIRKFQFKFELSNVLGGLQWTFKV
jgi:hypothetical protein